MKLSESTFEQGRIDIEAFLNREFFATQHHVGDDDVILIRTDLVEIVGRGKHQVVIQLNSGLVAKLPHRNKDWKKGSEVMIQGSYLHTLKTREALIDLGFCTPEMKLYHAEQLVDGIIVTQDVINLSWGDSLFGPDGEVRDWMVDDGRYPNVCITQDLRESGKYGVVEYDEETARSTTNGEELIAQYNAGCQKLKQLSHENPKNTSAYRISFKGHRLNTLDEAIKSIFLLQKPTQPDDPGRLVVGDLDHIYLYKE